jgi:glycosyltransferase involved in cell wall biosynthesis
VFCDPLDAASLSSGVEKLLNDQNLAAKVAEAARAQARERFHPSIIAKRHVEIYREVLSKPA